MPTRYRWTFGDERDGQPLYYSDNGGIGVPYTPVGGELRVARTFLEEWFAIWQDDLGRRRTREQAEQRYEIWQTDAEAAEVALLRRQQQHLDRDHFIRLSAFLQNPAWEPSLASIALSAPAAQVD